MIIYKPKLRTLRDEHLTKESRRYRTLISLMIGQVLFQQADIPIEEADRLAHEAILLADDLYMLSIHHVMEPDK